MKHWGQVTMNAYDVQNRSLDPWISVIRDSPQDTAERHADNVGGGLVLTRLASFFYFYFFHRLTLIHGTD